MTPDARQDLLIALTQEALGVDFGVVCLEAPEWPPVPRSLIRDLDGRSVYTRPGTTRYATRGQLDMEERMCQQAQCQGAPVLTPTFCATELGADAEALEAQLDARAQDATGRTATGLRMDQAAMIYEGLTSGRRVSVGVGPAGSGKTYTVAAGARAWQASGRRVVGLTCSQAARNVLVQAGITTSYNSTKFLHGIKNGRLAVTPGTLFIIDEGSMMPMADLAKIIDLAEHHDCKVFLTGDHEQLAAVESGGGMNLLAHHLGHTQLAVPVRFRAAWEQDASLRLRAADKAALEEYAEHGRITGGDRERAFDYARQAYVAGRLAGEDTLLMAYTGEDCRELSRAIRDDLIHLGLVDGGPSVQLSLGAQASAGDMIVCRENDHRVVTDPGHTLANGDIFRVESITPEGAMVRRVLDAAPNTGEMRLANNAVFYGARKLLKVTDLAYAVTGHNGQGGTVSRGLALITGRESLEWLYVAMTRGRARNTAIAVTRDGVRDKGGQKVAIQPREAEPRPGTRPDPELARRERRERERTGLPPEQVGQAEHEREPIAVLADCMDREDREDSASEFWRHALANADHLGILNARWMDLARKADRERYHALVMGALPAEYRQELGPQATWLYRTLRSAEAAGLDAREVIRAAVSSRPLTGARDVASVLDARLRKLVDPLVPLAPKPWSERVLETSDPELQEYVTGLAAAMDARAERLGDHIAETSPAWAVRVLGPVPEDPMDRLDWTRRASAIGGYRELYGIEDQANPIGPEPTCNAPEMRAAWYGAFAGITRTDTVDARTLPDSSLLHMRDSYASETGWAPPHVGRELREVRLGAESMRLQAVRAEAESRTAKDQRVAARQADIAGQARALENRYREHESILSEAMEDRRVWDKLTAGPRSLAVQADSEIRRRYPQQKIKPLESAEPRVPEAGVRQPGWLAELAEQRRAFREELEARQNVKVPSEDPDWEDDGPAWPEWRAQREAILQPPKPEIQPAEGVRELAKEAQAEALS